MQSLQRSPHEWLPSERHNVSSEHPDNEKRENQEDNRLKEVKTMSEEIKEKEQEEGCPA